MLQGERKLSAPDYKVGDDEISLRDRSPRFFWRGEAAYDLKAAALCLGALAATPIYLVALAVPIAFFAASRQCTPYLPKELIGIALFCVLILIFPFLKFPVGLAMLLPTAGLVARRTFVRPASQQP